MEERRAVLGSERISRRRFNALVSLFFFLLSFRELLSLSFYFCQDCVFLSCFLYTLCWWRQRCSSFYAANCLASFFFFSSCSPLVGPVTPVLNRKANEVGFFFFLSWCTTCYLFSSIAPFFFFQKIYVLLLLMPFSFFFLFNDICVFLFTLCCFFVFFFFLLSKPVVEMPRHWMRDKVYKKCTWQAVSNPLFFFFFRPDASSAAAFHVVRFFFSFRNICYCVPNRVPFFFVVVVLCVCFTAEV